MKKWFRITVLTVIIAVLATFLSLGTFAADTSESDVIAVQSATQLIQLFARIEDGSVSASCKIKLANDIDVMRVPVMLNKEFSGVFDGNGKTISGVTQPLFKQFNGKVTNLTLRGEVDATKDIFPDKSNPPLS